MILTVWPLSGSAGVVHQRTAKSPARYSGSEHSYLDLIARDDLDAIYLSTLWSWHAPMALAASGDFGKISSSELFAIDVKSSCY